MNIVFNSLNSGLANNGGSRTVILCAQALEELGHRCDIVATSDRFTWFDHKPVIQYIPSSTDVIIATGCTTVMTTLESWVPNKAWYIRGHETWMYSEEQLVELYNIPEIKNIVNSKGLQQKLFSYGADSTVVYPGLDLDMWGDRDLRHTSKTRIGCLYNKKPTKRWEDFVKLAEILGTDGYEYVGIGDTHRNDEFLTYFKANASINELNDIYSSCHIWFAPTELEGLHNVPIEAALCGCLIVCSDHLMNGMDYALQYVTAGVYESRNIEQAALFIENNDYDLGLIHEMQWLLKEMMGSRKECMKRMVKYLENPRSWRE